jgi:hypothetical protein
VPGWTNIPFFIRREIMEEKTLLLMKKFEQDHEVYVSATDKETYWIIYARIPKGGAQGVHNLHIGRKYVSGPNEEGNVLILPDPDNSENYLAESWGTMETIDDFLKKSLPHILADKEAADREEGTCGASCS